MPRAQQNKIYNTFIKGLITEAGPLTFPDNASTDEENCDLFAKGNRRRRLGVDLEDNFALSTQVVPLQEWRDYAISTNEWKTIGGDGNLNFLVLQIGATLYFYDQSIVPLSRGQKSFTVDLNDFKVSGARNVERSVIQVANGKGLLFVSSPKIETFFIEFASSSDTNPTLLDLTSGSYIGDMVNESGLSAIFDDDDDEALLDCGLSGSFVDGLSFAGVDFGDGNEKVIERVNTFGSNNFGYNESGTANGSIKIYGSNAAPASANNGTQLATTGEFTDDTDAQEKNFSISNTTAFRYVWATLAMADVASGRNMFAEIRIFERVASVTTPITTTQITVDVRDFEGVDDSLEPAEEPTSLSDEHSYNLKNQGWVAPGDGGLDPVATYQSSQSKYPPNSKQWWSGKDSSDVFQPATLTKFMVGNTLAPKGHFVLNAFSKDRTTASGVSNITTESISNRPQAIAFFAGRVWWAGVSGSKFNGNLYFNQILEGTTNIGRCYQVNDPTSEDLSGLLSSDGGVIVIPEIGVVKKLFTMQGALIVMADNGVWSISGTDGSFRATEFAVSKVSSIGITGPDSVVDVEGTPLWWGKTGISTVSQNEVTFQFGVQLLSKDTIQSFYEDIPLLSKDNCVGNYDQITKKVSWLYGDTAPIQDRDRYRFDRVLVLDTRLGAFIPWTLSTASSEPHYVGGVFDTATVSSATENGAILDGTDKIIAGTSDVVHIDTIIPGTSTFLKHLVFKEGTDEVQWAFGGFRSTSFSDWFSVDDAGQDYTSFFETGDELMGDIQRDKQATYVHVFFNRTETEYEDLSFETWIRPSGCFMQAKWEWSDSSNSGKFSPAAQVYRFKRRINEIILDGSDIVLDGVSQLFTNNIYTPSSGTDFDSGFPITITKNKVRGSGKALRLRFESETGKDFDLLGWAINFSGATAI